MLQWSLESLIEKNMTKKRNRPATGSKIVIDNQKRCIIKNLGLRDGGLFYQKTQVNLTGICHIQKVGFYEAGSFSLFPPYWEKLKTFPGDTKVHVTWSLRDAIQKSPSRNLSAQRRKERGNRQDLFLKTNLHAFRKAGSTAERLGRAKLRKAD